jgi:hypothetical protein
LLHTRTKEYPNAYGHARKDALVPTTEACTDFPIVTYQSQLNKQVPYLLAR